MELFDTYTDGAAATVKRRPTGLRLLGGADHKPRKWIPWGTVKFRGVVQKVSPLPMFLPDGRRCGRSSPSPQGVKAVEQLRIPAENSSTRPRGGP